MWGFASQTGAGLAIAGLTATYYALSHRNYYGEREVGHGDGPSVTHRERNVEEIPIVLSSSQMLLKKELEELSSISGSSSGLNILYQPSHPLYRFQKSRFEITPIISRVNTSYSTVFSESEDEFERKEEDVLPNNLVDPVESVDNDVLTGKAVAAENIEFLEMLKEEITPTPSLPLCIPSPSHSISEEDEAPEIMIRSEEDIISDKGSTIEDNTSLNRKASAICFFRNPGFGNRYAFRIKNEQNMPVISQALNSIQTPPTLPEVKVVSMDSKAVQVSPIPSTEDYKDSTQFIMSPILSESNMSLCDNQTPEIYIKYRKENQIKEREKLRKGKDAKLLQLQKGLERNPNESYMKETNPLEEISDYNEKLRKRMFQSRNCLQVKRTVKAGPLIMLRPDPEISNLCKIPETVNAHTTKRKGKPVLLPPPLEVKAANVPVVELPEEDVNQEKPEEKKPTTDEKNFADPQGYGDAPMPLNNTTEVDKSNAKDFKEEEPLSLDFTVTRPKGKDFTVASSKPVDVLEVVEEPVVVVPCRAHSCKVIPPRLSIPTFATSRASYVFRIPDHSWIALPVRVCANSIGTIPWNLVIFCFLVVIFAGFFGMILTKLANQIVIDKQL